MMMSKMEVVPFVNLLIKNLRILRLIKTNNFTIMKVREHNKIKIYKMMINNKDHNNNNRVNNKMTIWFKILKIIDKIN